MISKQQLQAIYEQIKAGSKKEATKQLVPLVRAEPNNAAAWWLVANAAATPEYQLRALKQLAKLRPDDPKVRAAIAHVEGDPFADVVHDDTNPFDETPRPKQNTEPELSEAIGMTWENIDLQTKRMLIGGTFVIVIVVILLFLFAPFLRRSNVSQTAQTSSSSHRDEAIAMLRSFIDANDGTDGERNHFNILWIQHETISGRVEYWCFVTEPVLINTYGTFMVPYDHFTFNYYVGESLNSLSNGAESSVWQGNGCAY